MNSYRMLSRIKPKAISQAGTETFLDPVTSLQALRTLADVLLIDNPCVRAKTTCLWLSPALERRLHSKFTSPRHHVESTYGVQTSGLEGGGSYVSRRQWQRTLGRAQLLPSDSYVCYGGTSHGSGRSVFIDSHQVKGVGRTNHAVFHDFFQDMNGALGLRAALAELVHARLLERLLTVSPIPIDFALLRGGEKGSRILLGRRGSPIRVGHLDFLLSASRRYIGSERGLAWRRFINAALGKRTDKLSGRAAAEVFRTILSLAMITLVEVRFFDIKLCNWPDNGDVFSRIFDTEHISFGNNEPSGRTSPISPRYRRQPPGLWLRDQLFDSATNSTHEYSLQCLQNASLAIDAIHQGLRSGSESMGESEFNLTWPELESLYSECFLRTALRVLGHESTSLSLTTHKRLRACVDAWGLIPSPRMRWTFSIRRFARGYSDGLMNRRPSEALADHLLGHSLGVDRLGRTRDPRRLKRDIERAVLLGELGSWDFVRNIDRKIDDCQLPHRNPSKAFSAVVSEADAEFDARVPHMQGPI